MNLTPEHLELVRRALLVLNGTRGSGDWGHTGRPGKRGGSGGGGGLKAIGVKPGSSVAERKEASQKKRGSKKSPAGGGGANTDPDTWNDRVTDKEADAINEYTSRRYQSINGGLRNPPPSKADQKVIDDIDSALSKSRLKEDTELWENQKLWRAADVPEIKAAGDDLIGVEFTEKAYTSTTTDFNVADNFRRGDAKMFVINAPKGTKAANVDAFSAFGDVESETLVGRNTKYKVSKTSFVNRKGKTLKRKGRGAIEVIHLDIIGQD